MIDMIMNWLTWPIRAGADHVIARLEAAEAEILDLWASWGDA